MTKERVQVLVVGLVVIVFVASALGYLLVPSAMLSIVGIQGNRQVNFLVRTHAAALNPEQAASSGGRRRSPTQAWPTRRCGSTRPSWRRARPARARLPRPR